ncbi:MAG: lactate utilization protein [Hyphomicrobiales bacterium]|nr:MAG: lactate utilization protein [Hyphomicrobiales bacterium]
MSGRDAILARLKRSLGVAGDDTERRTITETRLAETPRGVIPKRGQLPLAERIGMFVEQAEKVQASVARIGSYDELPAALQTYLRDKNLPAALRRGNDPRLAGVPWDKTPTLDVQTGPSDGHDAVGLSHSFAGIAETGTLVLQSGADNPTTLNFLPETHIVVVAAEDITGDMETMWERLRAYNGKGTMPRTVNMITGPSRSGDIEQTILLGAHGPRALHIVVVG